MLRGPGCLVKFQLAPTIVVNMESASRILLHQRILSDKQNAVALRDGMESPVRSPFASFHAQEMEFASMEHVLASGAMRARHAQIEHTISIVSAVTSVQTFVQPIANLHLMLTCEELENNALLVARRSASLVV